MNNVLNNKTITQKPLLVFDGKVAVDDGLYIVKSCENNKYRLYERINQSYIKLLRTQYRICLQFGDKITGLFD